jgi:hypothetical protein
LSAACHLNCCIKKYGVKQALKRAALDGLHKIIETLLGAEIEHEFKR